MSSFDVVGTHRAITFAGQVCAFCGDPPAIRIRLMTPLLDFLEREPLEAARLMSEHHGTVPTVPTTSGQMVCKEDFVSCVRCRKEAEVCIARRAKSWELVDIDEGPKDTITFAVSGR